MADGSTKAIETIQPGEQLLAYDIENGRTVPATVLQSLVRQYRNTLVTLDGRVRVTMDHPFFVDGRWVPAGELREGDRIYSLDDQAALALMGQSAGGTPVSVQASPYTLKEIAYESIHEVVYNLEVANLHNYFAHGLLVHNPMVVVY